MLTSCIVIFSQSKSAEYERQTGVLAGLMKERGRAGIKQVKTERGQHSITYTHKIIFSNLQN